MLRALSTHLFLNQRLRPGMLELARRARAEAVEIFAARQHFDYTNRRKRQRNWVIGFAPTRFKPGQCMRRSNADREMGRGGGPAVNVLHPEKARRIDAMDEIKRALETAEQIAFRNLSSTSENNRMDGRHGPWNSRGGS